MAHNAAACQEPCGAKLYISASNSDLGRSDWRMILSNAALLAHSSESVLFENATNLRPERT